MIQLRTLALILVAAVWLTGCGNSNQANPAKQPPVTETTPSAETAASNAPQAPQAPKINPESYAEFTLTADLNGFSKQQRQMIGFLIDAAKIMDELYWRQTYGDRDELLNSIKDTRARRFADINYGPWDRLSGDAPFLPDMGAKPKGARFYPGDMTKAQFEAAKLPGKDGLYSLIRRDDQGALQVVPYHVVYAKPLKQAAALLSLAADLAQDPEFANYLRLRATALTTDDYQPSDMAWMDMKNNPIDVVIGAIETYEDQLFGYRAAYEAYVLIKDPVWSKRLAHFIQFLPALQRDLPVPDAYKSETPGSNSDLNAYDAVYYAGQANAGAKTIAINLPNDEQVQLKKGTRRLQLKNAMRAKFDKIMAPIADLLIAEDQRQHVTFNAFFSNTMFHEVAHGLGIKNTINGRGLVRPALKELASAIEEGKADILGLYMVTKLLQRGEIKQGVLADYYATFLAGIFRSVRFGAADAHGRANMVRFNFFQQRGAFSRDAASGRYHVNMGAFGKAVTALSTKLLTLQGDGNYAATKDFMDRMAVIHPTLRQDLDRVGQANIPVDIVFKQGKTVLGL